MSIIHISAGPSGEGPPGCEATVSKITPKWVPRGTQNRSKIDKNQDLGSKVSGWASPVTLDQQTAIKMMTQDPQNGAPRPPKCQDSRSHMHKAWPLHFFILQPIRPGLGFQNASQPITSDRGAGGRGLRPLDNHVVYVLYVRCYISYIITCYT